jgi:hypothetical protein
VLFSREPVANFINESFEPVWESVRPVPIVRIDFGNGNVLTRTLHGNILTSICTPDGFVVDALPGIYREAEYLSQLKLLCAVAKKAQAVTHEHRVRDNLVRAYHRGQAKILKGIIKPEQVARELIMAAMSKKQIELPLELVLLPASMPALPPLRQQRPEAGPAEIAAEDVAHWKELEEDTRLNERSRRLWIHSLLEKTGLVKPEKVTRPIYKEVLHADLDDPYLGLGEVLFAKYPFAKEDAAHRFNPSRDYKEAGSGVASAPRGQHSGR